MPSRTARCWLEESWGSGIEVWLNCNPAWNVGLMVTPLYLSEVWLDWSQVPPLYMYPTLAFTAPTVPVKMYLLEPTKLESPKFQD